jgi:hypothetical protein
MGGYLFLQRCERLLEHLPMSWGRGAGEIIGNPLPCQLEGAAVFRPSELVGSRRRLSRLRPGSVFLL